LWVLVGGGGGGGGWVGGWGGGGGAPVCDVRVCDGRYMYR
jgi:hypothetical protein